MKHRLLWVTFAVVLHSPALSAAAQAPGSEDAARALLSDFEAHGYASPLVALRRLQAVKPPASTAPLELRWRFENALAQHANRLHEFALADAAMARLQDMATREACRPCGMAWLLRQTQRADGAADHPALKSLLARLEAQAAPEEPQLRFELLLMRAFARRTLGDLDDSIALAAQAGMLAERERRPADAVAALALMAAVNADRDDLPRAAALASEGYARASEIGFTYLMAYLRLSEGYSRSALKQHDRYRVAIEEALRLSRSVPGMERFELMALGHLAGIRYREGRFEEAYRHATDAEHMAVTFHDEQGRAFALSYRGASRVKLGDANGGLALMRQGLSLKWGSGDESLDDLELLAEVLESAGRPGEALQTLRKAIEVRSRLTQAEREKALLDVQEKFAAERKSRQIEMLQLDNARQRAEAAALSTQRWLWATAAMASGLAAVALWQWSTRVRRRNRHLELDNAELSERSSVDALTGAFNRRHGDELLSKLQQRVQHARRSADVAPVASLLLLDIDFFKKVNDTHGHAAGDAVLVAVAQRLKALLRDEDVVVRWGGEEFVLVLPGTPPQALPLVAERVLQAIGATPVAVGGQLQVPVRASGGAIAWPAVPGQSWQDALHLADLALYLSKTAGRNRATCVGNLQADAPSERLEAGLAACASEGLVSLQVVSGPAVPPAAAPAHPVPAAPLTAARLPC
jgi:diguanylate cyclase (GGDEF)-like protein